MTTLNPAFEKAFERIIGHEGGLSLRANDPGNWTGGKVNVGELKGTKYGISAAAFPKKDIKNLSLLQAKVLYKEEYWDKYKLDLIDSTALKFQMFDYGLNSGMSRMFKAIQGLIGAKETGSMSVQLAEELNRQNARSLSTRLLSQRLNYLVNHPDWSINSGGWTRRQANNLNYLAEDL